MITSSFDWIRVGGRKLEFQADTAAPNVIERQCPGVLVSRRCGVENVGVWLSEVSCRRPLEPGPHRAHPGRSAAGSAAAPD